MTTASPEISICIPVYNGERYLGDCLRSVQRQTVANVEILIVDDGSRDGSNAIALSHAAHDPRVRVVTNPHNLGLVGNWNRCLELAVGTWIKFVFQDDEIAPDCLERMLRATGPDTVLVACSREFDFESTTPPELKAWYTANRSSIEQQWGSRPCTIEADRVCRATTARPGANLFGEPTSMLVRRSAFAQHGNFNADLIMSCDLEYWTRIAVHAGFEWVPERLATFRVHDGATSAENRGSRSFRMDVLDNVVLMHEFAFSPVYEPLRRFAAAQQPPVDFEDVFRDKAKWGWRAAVETSVGSAPGTRSPLEEWEVVARQYPRIRAGGAVPRPPTLTARLMSLARRVRGRPAPDKHGCE